jgi:hypothetical protein
MGLCDGFASLRQVPPAGVINAWRSTVVTVDSGSSTGRAPKPVPKYDEISAWWCRTR